MPRLSATHLLTLVSLLVALVLGVVVIGELPAILRSTISRAPAPASPVPTSTPATHPAPAASPSAVPPGTAASAPPSGTAACSDSNLSVTLRPRQVESGGWLANAIVLTNRGAPCVIGGYATVTRLDGGVAVPTGDDFLPYAGPSFTLASGATASFLVQWYAAGDPQLCPMTNGLDIAVSGSSVPIAIPFTLSACTEGVSALQVTAIGPGGTGGVG